MNYDSLEIACEAGAKEDDFDAAVRCVQDYLEVDDGFYASMYFSGSDHEAEWKTADEGERYLTLFVYGESERNGLERYTKAYECDECGETWTEGDNEHNLDECPACGAVVREFDDYLSAIETEDEGEGLCYVRGRD